MMTQAMSLADVQRDVQQRSRNYVNVDVSRLRNFKFSLNSVRANLPQSRTNEFDVLTITALANLYRRSRVRRVCHIGDLYYFFFRPASDNSTALAFSLMNEFHDRSRSHREQLPSISQT